MSGEIASRLGPACYSPQPSRRGLFRTCETGCLSAFWPPLYGDQTMKLTIERAALLKALAHVQSVVERRNTIPILSNVLITAQKGRLSLAATDMDLAITETVDANASKPCATTTQAHSLYEIV